MNMDTGVYHLKKGKSPIKANSSKPGNEGHLCKDRTHSQASRADENGPAAQTGWEGRGSRDCHRRTHWERAESGQDFFHLFGNEELKHHKYTQRQLNNQLKFYYWLENHYSSDAQCASPPLLCSTEIRFSKCTLWTLNSLSTQRLLRKLLFLIIVFLKSLGHEEFA